METIVKQNLEEEMSQSFLEYSMAVITDRAIPDVYDGLKPVHRRILFGMIEQLKLKSNKPYVKSAKISGTVTASTHFHSDSSVYDAACNLTTKHTMRYPLIDGQGSFGDVTGSGAAAMRYTEMRPSKIAELMMIDYNKNAVNTKLNFSEDLYEPVVLPGLFPQILCNPTMGIAVGMASNFASHNLTEVCNGIIAYIKNKDIDTAGLMEYIKGPDFPLGGVITNSRDIFHAYDTGRSATTLRVRGEYEVKGKEIIFSSLPYNVSTDKIIAQITKNISAFEDYFVDFRDDSNDENGVKIVFTLADINDLEPALGLIFSKTDLEDTFSINQNCLVNGSPRVLSLKEIIQYYVEHQIDVIQRVHKFDLDKHEAKLHILKGLIIALENIDAVVELIKSSKDKKSAKAALIDRYSLDDIQAEEVLNMRLSKLTSLEIEDLRAEIKDLTEKVEDLRDFMSSSERQEKYLISEIEDMRDKYGDARRTKLENYETKKVVKEKAVIPSTPVIVCFNKAGYLKRAANKTAARDAVVSIEIPMNEVLVVFDTTNTAHKIPVHKLEDTYKALNNYVKNCGSIMSIGNAASDDEYLFITKNGMIRKTNMKEFNSNRAVIAMKLKDGDSLFKIIPSVDTITLYTSQNRALTITVDIKATGRTAQGVKSLNLKEGEYINAVNVGEDSKVEKGKRGGVPKKLK